MGEGAPFSGRWAGPRTGSLSGGEECRQSASMPQLSSEVKTALSVVVPCDDQTKLSLAWARPSQLSGILSIIRAAANFFSMTNY